MTTDINSLPNDIELLKKMHIDKYPPRYDEFIGDYKAHNHNQEDTHGST
jgi:hypothetical protein